MSVISFSVPTDLQIAGNLTVNSLGGLLKGTAGLVSVATAGVDYATPAQTTSTGVQLGASIASLSGFTTNMSGQLQLLITGAANDVNSINGATGDITLTSAPANANYVKVSTSGTTIYISGDSAPLLSGVTFAGGAGISGTAGNLLLNPVGAGGVGIATTSPAAVLEVASGSIRASRPGTPTQYLEFTAGLAAGPLIVASGAGKQLTISNASNGGISFNTLTNGQSLVIQDDGKVAIGTAVFNNPANGILQLVTHTTSGGGIGLGPDVSIWRTAANAVSTNAAFTSTASFNAPSIFANSTTIQLLGTSSDIRLSNGRQFDLTFDSSTLKWRDNSAGQDIWSYSTGAGHILTAAGGTALTLNNNRNAVFASGLFFTDTGNYTLSGVASVAQLLTLSGFDAAALSTLTGGAFPNVVYTTGAQSILGQKTITAFISTGEPHFAFDNLYSDPAGGKTCDAKFGGGSFGIAVRGISYFSSGFTVGSFGTTAPPQGGMIVAGNVGIGTTTPQGSLQVASTATQNYGSFTNTFVAGATGLLGGVSIGYDTTNNQGFIQSISPGNAWRKLVIQQNGLNFRNASDVDWMTLSSTSLVGIGTLAPAQLLHVSGGSLRVDGSGLFGGTAPRVGIGTLTPGYALNVFDGATEVMQLSSTKAAFNKVGDIGGSLIMSIAGADRWTWVNDGSLNSAGTNAGNVVPFTVRVGQSNPQTGDLTNWQINSVKVAAITAQSGFWVSGALFVGTTGASDSTLKLHVSGGNLRVDGSGNLAGTLTLGSGLILGTSNVTGGGIAFSDMNLFRSTTKQLTLDAAGGVTLNLTNSAANAMFIQSTSTNGVVASYGSLIFRTTDGGTNALTLNSNTTATFASGIILGSSNVTGGGVAFSDTVLYRASQGILGIAGPFGTPTLRFFSNGGNAATLNFDNTIFKITQVPSIGFDTNNGATRALTLDATQNAQFMSGIFFRDTGNYTASGVASVAQLLAVSGGLSTITVTGSGPVQAPNFIAIGGGTVTLSGVNTVVISGGGGGSSIITGGFYSGSYINFDFRSNIALTPGVSSQVIPFSATFPFVPFVTTQLSNSAGDPFLGSYVAGTPTTTGFTIAFSSNVPTSNYTLSYTATSGAGYVQLGGGNTGSSNLGAIIYLANTFI